MELHYCEDCERYLLETEESVAEYRTEVFLLDITNGNSFYDIEVGGNIDDVSVIAIRCPLCGEELGEGRILSDKEKEALHMYLWTHPELDWSDGIPMDDPSLVEIFL